MNWRGERDSAVTPPDYLAQRILDGLAQPGVHRALVDLDSWKLLKWLDEPADFYDWRTSEVHPDDAAHMERMTREFSTGTTVAVLRLKAADGQWAPVQMTINRIELEPGTFAGLIALRRADSEETGQPPPG
jgi:hypothetical protein